MKCKELETCSFFNEVIKDMPATAEMMKRRFCFGDFESCARVMVFRASGAGSVPRDLAPNDRQRADKIISEP